MNSRKTKTNSRKINWKYYSQVPNTVSISKGILFHVSKFLEKNDLSTYVWNYSPTSGLLTNCSKLLMSDTRIFLDQNMCFLKDVLVSKQKILYLLDFDQIVYIYIYISWRYRGQVSLQNLKVLEHRYWLNLSEMGNQLIFSKCFTPVWLLLSSWRQYLTYTSVLDQLQLTFQFLIQIWLPSWAGIIKIWLN